MFFYMISNRVYVKEKVEKCKFLNPKPLSDGLSFAVQLSEVRLGKFSYSYFTFSYRKPSSVKWGWGGAWQFSFCSIQL